MSFDLPPEGPRDLQPFDIPLPGLDGNVLPLDGGTAAFAHLVLTVTDGESGLPIPSRVIFRPVPGAGFADSITFGTPDPLSSGGATGAVVGPGVLGSNEGVLLSSGLGVVPVPPGTYTLFITRGPEYEAVETAVTVAAGEVRPIDAQLDRSVDTRGWLAADLHVHVGRSFDSKLPAERRVISMVSNGIEVIVATDHNVATDLAPHVAALGYDADTVGTIVGDEFNFAEGHGGAYPVPYDATKPEGGAPPWISPCTPPVGINCFTAVSAFPMMHQQIPNMTVVTVNHPWWGGADLGYFTNIQWGAGTANPLPAVLDSAGLFEGLEVLNGYQARDVPLANLVADWFYLLGQGHRVTALGSSDTHRINWVRAGFPRTWLRLPNDRPGDITNAGLADAIRRGRAVASTGPFVTLTVDEAQIGDTVVPKSAGKVSVAVRVDAPGWMKVDTVRLYVNGALRRTFAVSAGLRPVFAATFDEPLAAGADAWVVAFASGTQPLPGDVVGEYSQANGYAMLPWAITNPVFVDGNNDGQWQPPASPAGGGLRPPSPPLFRRPLNVPAHCELGGLGTEPPLDYPRALMPLLAP